MDLSSWNAEGRRKNKRVCKAFDDIVDEGGRSKEDLAADEREPKLADAVLKEVVALNKQGKWQEARERFVLHVIDPWTRAEPGRERGYRPRRELYRWIFWDTLKTPIRW